jgi:hypothetical protein
MKCRHAQWLKVLKKTLRTERGRRKKQQPSITFDHYSPIASQNLTK